jgi:hypothetical protein
LNTMDMAVRWIIPWREKALLRLANHSRHWCNFPYLRRR